MGFERALIPELLKEIVDVGQIEFFGIAVGEPKSATAEGRIHQLETLLRPSPLIIAVVNDVVIEGSDTFILRLYNMSLKNVMSKGSDTSCFKPQPFGPLQSTEISVSMPQSTSSIFLMSSDRSVRS